METTNRIRSEFIQSQAQARSPGALSLEEETTCGYMATAAYRAQHGAGPPDADLERWSRAYDHNLLREAVIYETIGCRRPEVLRTAMAPMRKPQPRRFLMFC